MFRRVSPFVMAFSSLHSCSVLGDETSKKLLRPNLKSLRASDKGANTSVLLEVTM